MLSTSKDSTFFEHGFSAWCFFRRPQNYCSLWLCKRWTKRTYICNEKKNDKSLINIFCQFWFEYYSYLLIVGWPTGTTLYCCIIIWWHFDAKQRNTDDTLTSSFTDVRMRRHPKFLASWSTSSLKVIRNSIFTLIAYFKIFKFWIHII